MFLESGIKGANETKQTNKKLFGQPMRKNGVSKNPVYIK